jgi:hypothetical protein
MRLVPNVRRAQPLDPAPAQLPLAARGVALDPVLKQALDRIDRLEKHVAALEANNVIGASYTPGAGNVW